MKTTEEIAEIEKWLGLRLPAMYAQFLLDHPEKKFGDCVVLYSAEDLVE